MTIDKDNDDIGQCKQKQTATLPKGKLNTLD